MWLALAIDGGFTGRDAGFVAPVEPDVARALAEFLLAEVLILPTGDAGGELGTACLVAVETGEVGLPCARFDAGRRIGAVGARVATGHGPFPLQFMPEADVLAIVAAASGEAFAQGVTPGGEIGEMAVGFATSAATDATAGAVMAALRRESGNRCALTGVPLVPDALPVAIRWDGPERLHLNNLLLLSPAAEIAFRQGHLTVRDDFSLIVDVRRIDPELLERLNADGRLRVHDNPMLRPSTINLAWHRQWIFGLG